MFWLSSKPIFVSFTTLFVCFFTLSPHKYFVYGINHTLSGLHISNTHVPATLLLSLVIHRHGFQFHLSFIRSGLCVNVLLCSHYRPWPSQLTCVSSQLTCLLVPHPLTSSPDLSICTFCLFFCSVPQLYHSVFDPDHVIIWPGLCFLWFLPQSASLYFVSLLAFFCMLFFPFEVKTLYFYIRLLSRALGSLFWELWHL